MMLQLDPITIKLEGSYLLKIRDGMKWRLLCHAGRIWITQENDPRDILLSQGQGFTLDHAGLTLVGAVSPAEIVIQKPLRHQSLLLTSQSSAWGKAYRL